MSVITVFIFNSLNEISTPEGKTRIDPIQSTDEQITLNISIEY